MGWCWTASYEDMGVLTSHSQSQQFLAQHLAKQDPGAAAGGRPSQSGSAAARDDVLVSALLVPSGAVLLPRVIVALFGSPDGTTREAAAAAAAELCRDFTPALVRSLAGLVASQQRLALARVLSVAAAGVARYLPATVPTAVMQRAVRPMRWRADGRAALLRAGALSRLLRLLGGTPRARLPTDVADGGQEAAAEEEPDEFVAKEAEPALVDFYRATGTAGTEHEPQVAAGYRTKVVPWKSVAADALQASEQRHLLRLLRLLCGADAQTHAECAERGGAPMLLRVARDRGRRWDVRAEALLGLRSWLAVHGALAFVARMMARGHFDGASSDGSALPPRAPLAMTAAETAQLTAACCELIMLAGGGHGVGGGAVSGRRTSPESADSQSRAPADSQSCAAAGIVRRMTAQVAMEEAGGLLCELAADTLLAHRGDSDDHPQMMAAGGAGVSSPSRRSRRAARDGSRRRGSGSLGAATAATAGSGVQESAAAEAPRLRWDPAALMVRRVATGGAATAAAGCLVLRGPPLARGRFLSLSELELELDVEGEVDDEHGVGAASAGAGSAGDGICRHHYQWMCGGQALAEAPNGPRLPLAAVPISVASACTSGDAGDGGGSGSGGSGGGSGVGSGSAGGAPSARAVANPGHVQEALDPAFSCVVWSHAAWAASAPAEWQRPMVRARGRVLSSDVLQRVCFGLGMAAAAAMLRQRAAGAPSRLQCLVS